MDLLPPNACKHDAGFKFFACSAADRLPGVFGCLHLCGFALRFDPDVAGRYRKADWATREVVYLSKPGPSQTKSATPLTPSKF